MENSTVWNEQICRGFLTALTANVKVRGSNNTLVPVTNIVVSKPELAFNFDRMPAVTIRNYDVKRAVVNQMGVEPTYENYDTENGTVEYTNQPLKFWLYYQIDFWSEFQEDMDNMMLTWLKVMPDVGGKLTVLDTDNVSQTVSCSLIGMAVLDSTDSQQRLFRRALSYKVSGRIDRGAEVRKYVSSVSVGID